MGRRAVAYISSIAAVLGFASIGASLTREVRNLGPTAISATQTATPASCDALVGDSYQNCWAGLLNKVTMFAGPSAALKSLHESSSTRVLLGSMCHELEHAIGQEAFSLSMDVALTMRHADTKCQYGYVHGVLESYAKQSSRASVESSFVTVCAQFDNPTDTPLLIVECTHGLGHAASIIENQSMSKAVLLCDLLGAQTRSSVYCAGGVLMEYGQSLLKRTSGVGSAASGAHGPGMSVLTPGEARNPCESIPDRYKAQCWARISLFWGGEFKDDVDGLIERCSKEAELWVSLCNRSAGEWVLRRGQVHPYSGSDLREYVISHCKTAAIDQFGSCLAGAVFGQTLTEIALNVPFAETLKLCAEVRVPLANKECRAAEREAVMSVSDRSLRVGIGTARGFTSAEMETLEVPTL